MKKYSLVLLLTTYYLLFTVFIGCGKNEKKTSLLTGSGVATTTESTVASVAADAATLATKTAGGRPTGFAIHLVSPLNSIRQTIPGLTGPDGDGFYSYPGYTGSTMKIRFLNSSRNPITNLLLMTTLVYVNVKISSVYEFGTFNGDFTMVYSTSSVETMDSGTITTSDPVGGTFTAVISNMTIEKRTITVQGTSITVGTPISGTMAITGSSGYTGTNTYSKSGSSYKCEGPIYYQGQQVAYVYLTFSDTFGNYTGYYTDMAGNTHVIQ